MRHDVMSHVYAYGQQCPKAKGIIHLGATSCYVGDNTDLIIMTEGLRLVRKKTDQRDGRAGKIRRQIQKPADPGIYPFPAGPADYRGQSATLWLNELCLDLEDLDHVLSTMKLWLQGNHRYPGKLLGAV